MSDELLRQLAADMAEMKAMLAALVTEKKTTPPAPSTFDDELAMIDAQGLDIVEYFQNKNKLRRQRERDQKKARKRKTDN